MDKVTKANIVVVTGGNDGAKTIDFTNVLPLDSTELLINGQWEIGTIQCKIF